MLADSGEPARQDESDRDVELVGLVEVREEVRQKRIVVVAGDKRTTMRGRARGSGGCPEAETVGSSVLTDGSSVANARDRGISCDRRTIQRAGGEIVRLYGMT